MQTASLVRLPCRPIHLIEDASVALWGDLKAHQARLLPASLGLLPLAAAWPGLSLNTAVSALILWFLMCLITTQARPEQMAAPVILGLIWLIGVYELPDGSSTGIAWSIGGLLAGLTVARYCPWGWAQCLTKALAVCWMIHALSALLGQSLQLSQLILAALVVVHVDHHTSNTRSAYCGFALAIMTLAAMAITAVEMPLSALLLPAGLMVIIKAMLELADRRYPIPGTQHIMTVCLFVIAASLGSANPANILIFPLH